MYNPGKYRIHSIVLLIAFIISILLFSGFIWNIYLKSEKIFPIFWPVVLLLLATGTASAVFLIAMNLTDTGIFNKHIEHIIQDERTKVLSELEEKREKEKVVQTEETNIEELIIDLIPDHKGLKTVETFAAKLLVNIAEKFEIVQGLCYLHNKNVYSTIAQYAFTGEHTPEDFKLGETIPGQAAKNQELMVIGEIPENYFQIKSGLGFSLPKYILFVPVIYKNKTIVLLELASFKPINEKNLTIFKELTKNLGERFAKFIK